MKKILFVTLLCIALTTDAASYFFCNKTNQYVSLGDSLDQVQADCGTTSNKTTKTIPNQKTQKAEQWIYNYKPNSVPAEPQQNALVVTFVDNKATSITSSGQTPPCRPDLQLKKDDSPTLLYQYCKQPSQKQTITLPDGPDQTQTIITYPNGQNATIQLTFTDGKLTGIK